ncbi:MAG: DUF1800 family protein, partial [Planctomycetota bacterium]
MTRPPAFLATLFLAGAASAVPPESPLAPLPAEEWTIEKAGHLLRRAGFGGTLEEVAALHARGLQGAVESLLDWEGKPDPTAPDVDITVTEPPDRVELMGKSDEERKAVLDEYQRNDRQQLQRIRDWWMRLMISGSFPLRERMTLFWHGHFTSSFRDVRHSYLMFLQNTLFRRHAAGDFAALLHDISKDPAMLEYLDNRSNRKGKPNENYAREVMELFSL